MIINGSLTFRNLVALSALRAPSPNTTFKLYMSIENLTVVFALTGCFAREGWGGV